MSLTVDGEVKKQTYNVAIGGQLLSAAAYWVYFYICEYASWTTTPVTTPTYQPPPSVTSTSNPQT